MHLIRCDETCRFHQNWMKDKYIVLPFVMQNCFGVCVTLKSDAIDSNSQKHTFFV